MHIILPAKDINVLNPNSNASHFIPPQVGDNAYVEIGCKIFEVNNIQYNPAVWEELTELANVLNML